MQDGFSFLTPLSFLDQRLMSLFGDTKKKKKKTSFLFFFFQNMSSKSGLERMVISLSSFEYFFDQLKMWRER